MCTLGYCCRSTLVFFGTLLIKQLSMKFPSVYWNYSLSGHPSRPENWRFFQCSPMCTWQCCTLKCSATHPAFNPVRNVSRLFFCCAQWAKICYSCGTADKKWWPLTTWTSGQQISQLIGPTVRADFRRLYPANAKTPTCCPSDDNRTKVTNSVTSAQSLWWHVGPYFWPADLTRTANPIVGESDQHMVAWRAFWNISQVTCGRNAMTLSVTCHRVDYLHTSFSSQTL